MTSQPGPGFVERSASRRFDGRVFAVEEVDLTDPSGTAFTRDVVRHPGSVAVVPILGDDVVLLRQYRAPAGMEVLEIPAGTRDVAGETAATTAVRECEEEIGYRPGSVTLLAEFFNSPGYTDEYTMLFRADALEPVAGRPADPEEAHAHVVRIPLAEAVAMARRGDIVDVKTLVAILLVAD